MVEKRILILGPAWPFRGGIAASSERLAGVWQSEGASVDVHTFSRQYPDWLFPGSSQFSESPAPKDLHIERGLHGYQPLNWLRTAKMLADREYDIAVVRYWLPALAPALGTVARRIAANGRTRVVGLVDNFVPHESRPFDGLLNRYFAKAPHGFVAMSGTVAAALQSYAGNRPVVQRFHPVYDDFGESIPRAEARRQLELSGTGRIMLFFGFIRHYKGLDLLIEALGKLSDLADMQLLVAGEWYQDGAPVKALAERMGLSDRIIWHDRFIPDSMIRVYFSAADVIAQPYRSATQSGITAIAYRYEKPIITTNVGGLTEIIDAESGYICDPNVDSLSGAVQQWLTDPSPEKKIDGIRAFLPKMSWQALIGGIREAAGEVQPAEKL